MTVQCYPDVTVVNKTVKRYETFGWELIGNQRCQEYTGETRKKEYINGSWSTTVTRHYSSFNLLTFSREKTMPQYNEVIELEKECERILETKPIAPSLPRYRQPIIICMLILFVAGLVGIGLGAIMKGFLYVGIALLVVSAGMFIVTLADKCKYRDLCKEYINQLNNFEKSVMPQVEKIMAKADRIVNS